MLKMKQPSFPSTYTTLTEEERKKLTNQVATLDAKEKQNLKTVKLCCLTTVQPRTICDAVKFTYICHRWTVICNGPLFVDFDPIKKIIWCTFWQQLVNTNANFIADEFILVLVKGFYN